MVKISDCFRLKLSYTPQHVNAKHKGAHQSFLRLSEV